VAVPFLVGVCLVIRGLYGLLLKGEVPIQRRRGMFICLALGAFVV
jgi:hypothetical protein